MTLTIDFTPTEEARLDAAARQEGIDSATLVKKLVNNLPPATAQAASEQARIAAIHAARGSMAHLGVTVEDLHRERQADKNCEEQLGKKPKT